MIKKILLDILDYLRYQVENDKCTPDELRSIYNSLEDNIHVEATIDDIANKYNQSPSNVRNAISRGYVGKPKRRVYYNLMKIIKCVPHSWRSEQQVKG